MAQSIPEVVMVVPTVHGDARGYFMESFRKDALESYLSHTITFTQDNESKSTYGVLRGLHAQAAPYAQSKLVRVVVGEILDIALDIRQGSPTFGHHVAVELSADNKQQLWVPRGFAHGFVVLSDVAIVQYKVDNPYAPDAEIAIDALDASLGIDWRISQPDVMRSDKDTQATRWANFVSPFHYHEQYYG